MSSATKIEGENQPTVDEQFHPQDRLICVEALTYWASGHGPSEGTVKETADPRTHRAIELAEQLYETDLPDSAFTEAVDTAWTG